MKRPEGTSRPPSAMPVRYGRDLVLLLGLALAAASPAAAQRQGQGLYDESRVLEHQGNACRGMPDCVTVESRQRRIAKGESAIIRANCPANHPYVAGWDTEQHEHLHVAALPPAAPPGADPAKQVTTTSHVAVGATNSGDKAGVVTLFVGCAATPPRVTAVLRHRGGVPTNHNTFTGGSR